MSSRTWWGLLATVLIAHLVATWVHPHADPPQGYSQDFSQITDGYWYLEAARAKATGTDPHVDDNYKRPLITIPATWVLGTLGTNLASARALSSIASVVVLLLLACAVRQRHGPRVALVITALLGLHPLWLAYVRSPVIYPYVGAWLFASLYLASGRTWKRWIAGSLFLATGAVFLKSILWLALPALIVDALRRLGAWKRRLEVWWMVSALACAGIGLLILKWAAPGFFGKVLWYTGWESIGSNFVGFEGRTGLFAAAPILSAASFASLWLWQRKSSNATGRGRLDALLHLTVWGALVLFATCGYSPVRYLLVVLPSMAYLSASCFHAMACGVRDLPKREGLRGPSYRSLLGVVAVVHAFQVVELFHTGGSVPGFGFVTCLFAAGSVLVVVTERGRRVAAGALVAIFVLFTVPALSTMLVHPTYSLASVSTQLPALIPRGSKVFGNFAHAATFANHLDAQATFKLRYGSGRLKEQILARGSTHLLFDNEVSGQVPEIFERDGVPLEPLATFAVHGSAVSLFRVGISGQPRSHFEQGVMHLDAGDTDGAKQSFRRCLEEFPSCASAWVALGRLARQEGNPEVAVRCYEEALKHDPWRFDAHVGLADLFGTSGYSKEARAHIRAAHATMPESRELDRILDQVRSRIRARTEGVPSSEH